MTHSRTALCAILLISVLAVPAWGQIPAQANRYRAQLTREARAAWGLEAPVALFAAQVHQESGWREDARSPVGALGLAQFMPGTATWIAQVYPPISAMPRRSMRAGRCALW